VIVAIQTVVRAQLGWNRASDARLRRAERRDPRRQFHERCTACRLASARRLRGLLAGRWLGEFVLGAIVWATRMWLNERGVSERLIAVLGSVVVAHEAVHRLVDRGHTIAQSGSFGGEHALRG